MRIFITARARILTIVQISMAVIVRANTDSLKGWNMRFTWNPRCPDCHSANIRFARRWYSEKLLMLFHIRPYRCEGCHSRFFGFARARFRA